MSEHGDGRQMTSAPPQIAAGLQIVEADAGSDSPAKREACGPRDREPALIGGACPLEWGSGALADRRVGCSCDIPATVS